MKNIKEITMKDVKKMNMKEVTKLAARLGLDIATTIMLIYATGGTFTTAEAFLKAGKGLDTALKFGVNANGLKWMSAASTILTNGTIKKIINKF